MVVSRRTREGLRHSQRTRNDRDPVAANRGAEALEPLSSSSPAVVFNQILASTKSKRASSARPRSSRRSMIRLGKMKGSPSL